MLIRSPPEISWGVPTLVPTLVVRSILSGIVRPVHRLLNILLPKAKGFVELALALLGFDQTALEVLDLFVGVPLLFLGLLLIILELMSPANGVGALR